MEFSFAKNFLVDINNNNHKSANAIDNKNCKNMAESFKSFERKKNGFCIFFSCNVIRRSRTL